MDPPFTPRIPGGVSLRPPFIYLGKRSWIPGLEYRSVRRGVFDELAVTLWFGVFSLSLWSEYGKLDTINLYCHIRFF